MASPNTVRYGVTARVEKNSDNNMMGIFHTELQAPDSSEIERLVLGGTKRSNLSNSHVIISKLLTNTYN